MVDVNIFNVLTGNDIDLVIPLFVKRAKLFELLLLLFRKVREILEYERCVLQKFKN